MFSFFFPWTSSLSLVFWWWQATERNPASPTSAVTTHFLSFTSHHLKALNRLLNSKSIFPNKFQVRLCNIVVYWPNLITSNKHHQWLDWHFFFLFEKRLTSFLFQVQFFYWRCLFVSTAIHVIQFFFLLRHSLSYFELDLILFLWITESSSYWNVLEPYITSRVFKGLVYIEIVQNWNCHTCQQFCRNMLLINYLLLKRKWDLNEQTSFLPQIIVLWY